MYWSPQLLDRSFQKARNVTASVTRMQDLASEFSKIFREWHPRTLTTATPSRTQHPARPLTGLGVGTQTLVPLNFSAMVAPLE